MNAKRLIVISDTRPQERERNITSAPRAVTAMKITKKLLNEWDACWSDEQIDSYLGKRRSVSMREIAKDAAISPADRLWVLSRALWCLDVSAARGFSVECAISVARFAADEDDHLALCNQILAIEDLPASEQAAAYSAANAASHAAYSAAYSAACSAACSAASYAAYSAAYSAACSAASHAAYSAASYAAYSAAYSAAFEGYIVKALEWLGAHAD